MTLRSNELARARPLLGTLVEMRVEDCAQAAGALAAAFTAIAEVHRLLSAHEAGSDVARLNSTGAGRPLMVDEHTWRVLGVARQVSQASGGAFDVCVAPLLARWGYLPRAIAGRRRTSGWDAVELLPGRRVRLRGPVAVDLGGIAKGYAVDRAADALRSHGIRRFTVNAGGDLAVGEGVETIHVRHPGVPGRTIPLARVSNAAVATSAPYFSRKRRRRSSVFPIAVPGTARCADVQGSITVFADDCVLADALTKVVAVLGPASAPVLQRFCAAACVTDPSGIVQQIGAARR